MGAVAAAHTEDEHDEFGYVGNKATVLDHGKYLPLCCPHDLFHFLILKGKGGYINVLLYDVYVVEAVGSVFGEVRLDTRKIVVNAHLLEKLTSCRLLTCVTVYGTAADSNVPQPGKALLKWLSFLNKHFAIGIEYTHVNGEMIVAILYAMSSYHSSRLENPILVVNIPKLH